MTLDPEPETGDGLLVEVAPDPGGEVSRRAVVLKVWSMGGGAGDEPFTGNEDMRAVIDWTSPAVCCVVAAYLKPGVRGDTGRGKRLDLMGEIGCGALISATLLLIGERIVLLGGIDEGVSAGMEMVVPKRADESDESSTITLARLGNVVAELQIVLTELLSGGSGVDDEALSVRRKDERVRVGRRRKVPEPGSEGRRAGEQC